MDKTAVVPAVIKPGAGGPPSPPAKRRTGKPKGWLYFRSVADAKAAIQRVFNLTLVGDTKAELKDGEAPPKLDAATANALANLTRTWMQLHQLTMEGEIRRLRELRRKNDELHSEHDRLVREDHKRVHRILEPWIPQGGPS